MVMLSFGILLVQNVVGIRICTTLLATRYSSSFRLSLPLRLFLPLWKWLFFKKTKFF